MKIQSSIYRDKLELCDSKGELVKELPFTVNLTKTARTVLQKREAMEAIQPGDTEALGAAFQELLVSIFGEETTAELVDYFNADYLTMLTDLAPVLTDYIFPVFYKYRKASLDVKKKVKK